MPMVELLFSLFMVYFVVGRSVGRSVDRFTLFVWQ